MSQTTLNRSYFFDQETGWGNRSYFTFFSEFNRPWKGYGYFEAVAFIVIFVLSIFVNIWIIYQIIKTQSIRTVTNYFICNLAFGDMFFTLTCPLIAVERVVETWVLGEFLCHVMVFSLFVSGFVIMWTMTLISIDRYICINRPSTRKVTPKMALVCIAILWIFAFACSSPIAVFFVVREFPYGASTVEICTLIWPATKVRISTVFTTILCIFGFLMPLAIIGVNYFLIIKRFIKSKRTIAQIKSNGAKSKKRQRELREFRVIQTLVLVVVLFIVMWLPIFIVFVLIQLDGMADKMKLSSQIFIAALAVALCNAWMNPFVYGIRNNRIKRTALKCLFCHRRTVKVNNTPHKTNDQSVYALSFSQNSSSMY